MGLLRTRLLIAILAACAPCLLSVASDSPAAPVTVRFVEPSTSTLVQGPTRIVLEASTSPDARIVKVTLYVEDTLLTVLEKPPYAVTWDAGRSPSARHLRAVAIDSEGRSGESTLMTRVVPIGQYEEVRLVTVYASVRNAAGRPVLDLGREAFTLLEDGVPQTISQFSAARAPLTIALLIDASSSMRLAGKIDLARKGAEEFVDSVDDKDQVLVVAFDDALHGGQSPTSDRRRIKDQIRAIEPGGGTALYDALYSVSGSLQEIEGRRAMVLLSDGRDQALAENEPGSLHLLEEALERAHRADVAIYAIGLGRHLETELDLRRARSLKEILETLARQTGGRAYFPERAGQLGGVYQQIASDLRQQYTLAYTSTNTTRDGRWRAITVRTAQTGLAVEAREGYYAPGPGAP